MRIGAPSLHVGDSAKPVTCERCKAPVRRLESVHRRRLGPRRKPGWAFVCAPCFEALGRPDDAVTWSD